MKFVHVSLI